MGFYERQFGEREKEGRTSREKTLPLSREPGILMSNYYRLLVTNFSFVLWFLPAMVCGYLYLMLGSVLLLALTLLALTLAGPACVSMYSMGFEMSRQEQCPQGFWRCCFRNLPKGWAAMAVTAAAMTPMLLCMTMVGAGAQPPVWLTVCLILQGYVICGFSILCFAQIALVELPMKQIICNAGRLLVGLGGPILIPAALHMAFFAAVYLWSRVAFLAVLFLGPACLVVWTANRLRPRLEELLIS